MYNVVIHIIPISLLSSFLNYINYCYFILVQIATPQFIYEFLINIVISFILKKMVVTSFKITIQKLIFIVDDSKINFIRFFFVK
jgi:hypothetical protein